MAVLVWFKSDLKSHFTGGTWKMRSGREVRGGDGRWREVEGVRGGGRR